MGIYSEALLKALDAENILLEQHYPFKKCLADGKKEGLSQSEAWWRCVYIACKVSKRQNKFKESGFCSKTFPGLLKKKGKPKKVWM